MADNFDIPIFQKTYDLFRLLHGYQNTIPKAERYTLWQKIENTSLEILEELMQVSYTPQEKRGDKLKKISPRVDMLRVFLRLTHEIKIIDQKKYIAIQSMVDEIGRMLGGWIKKTTETKETL